MPGKPCGLLFIVRSLNLKEGLASLGSIRRNQAPLNLSCGPMYGNIHAQNVIFFFHLHVQSVGRDTRLHSDVSLNYECGR